jgi:hypothetical protein
MASRATSAFLLGSLLSCLVACASDVGIRQEAPPAPLSSLVARLPFLAPLLADARQAPAVPRGRGFVVEGRSHEGGRTRIELGARALDALQVEGCGETVAIRREGASAREGRLEDGVLFYPDAFPGADALIVAQGEGVEELIVARSPAAELVYALDLPAGWRLWAHGDQGLAEVLDGRGVARLRLRADRAWDAGGASVRLTLAAEGSRLRLRVEGAARWPVVVDPVFVGTGSLLSSRTEHTATALEDGSVLLVGGHKEADLGAELYDPTTGRFTAVAGAASLRRQEHSATRLKDGMVLLVGGADPENNLSTLGSAEIFDPVSRTFSPTETPVNTPRYGHTATLLEDGRILIAGGQQDAIPLDSAELYDPVSRRFLPVASPMKSVRSQHTATRLADGRVLLMGGVSYETPIAEIFDPIDQSFSPVSVPIENRTNHTATRLADGRVLIAGGWGSAGPLDRLEIFDPTASSVRQLEARLLSARVLHTATLLDDGRVILAGGTLTGLSSLGNAELFLPDLEQVRAADSLLLKARARHTATTLASGAILLAGGDDAGQSAELLELGAFEATAVAPCLPMQWQTSTLLADGRVLSVGGTSLNAASLFDPASGRFSLVKSHLQQNRERHTATVLGDGTILLAGGDDWTLFGVLGSAERFDPISETFELVAGLMSHKRQNHTATVLGDGTVLLAGGIGASNFSQASADRYWPAARSFQEVSPMLTARAYHTATLLEDGTVLVAGGLSESGGFVNGAELYDPVSGGFTATASPLKQERFGHTATWLASGQVLITGGATGSPKAKSAELYDPVTRTFSWIAGAMTASRVYHSATLLLDGRVLIAGGDLNPPGSAEIYDPSSGLFTKIASPMQHQRSSHTATRLVDGRVLLIGGEAGLPLSSTAEIYDPATDQFLSLDLGPSLAGRAATETRDGTLWLSGGDASIELTENGWSWREASSPARVHHAAVLLPEGDVLLVGGQAPGGPPLASVVRALAAGGQEDAGTLAHPRSRHSATRLPDGRIFVAGGEDEGGPLGSFELLTPGQVKTKVGALLQPRTRHAAALLPDGRILLVGGTNQQGDLAIAEVFDPVLGRVEGVGEAQVGVDASSGFVGSATLLFSGATKSVHFEPATNAFLDLDLEAGSQIATLATGRALACRDVCRFLAESSSSGGDAGSLALQPGDLIKTMGFGALGFAADRGGLGRLGWASSLEAAAPRSSLAPLPKDTWRAGERATVSGQGWPVTVPTSALPRLDDPLVLAWKPLDSAGPVHPLQVQRWGEGFVDFTLPTTAYSGPGWLYAIVKGVPGEGRLLILQPAPQGQPCGIDAHCASGFCVDGICCDQRCQDGCLACSAQAKHQGQDGVCGPVAAGGSPRGGCANPAGEVCGFTGACDGAGACVLPGINTECNDRGDRCQGGVCAPPPGLVCDDRTDEVVSVSGRRSCGQYRCRDGACLVACSSHLDCSADNHCDPQGRCASGLTIDAPGDPGWTCAAGARPGGGGWILAAAAVAAGSWRRRRRGAVAAGLGMALTASLARSQGRHEAAPAPSSSAASPVDPRKEEARDLLRKGLALYQAGETPGALDFFLRSRAIFPAKGNTINAANCLRMLGRFDEALELYEEAVAGYASSFDEDDRVAVPAAMAQMRARVGSLFVSASATGTLIVDGRERGKLPLSSAIRLLPGEHTVRVAKDGYQTFEARVNIMLGEQVDLDARLEPLAAAGGLRVEVPGLEGAEVVVDGVVVGQTPWEGTLAPGPHVVFSRKGSDGSAPTLATVLQGQTALLRLRSSRLGATRRLRVRPETAEPRLGEVPLGKGQWVGALPVGVSTISAVEEGYLTTTYRLIIDDDSRGEEVVLDLAVDEAHPRWPRKPTGKLAIEARVMLGLGAGLRGGAGGFCGGCGLLGGPAAAIGVLYEFPFHLTIEAALGGVSLSQRIARDMPRRWGVGNSDGVSYHLVDLPRFKGYWLGAGAGHRLPLGGRWSLRSRVLAGVILARSSDAISAAVTTPGGEAPAFVEGSGGETPSTPVFVLPEVGVAASFGEWQLAGMLGALVVLTTGPALPTGALRVLPDCPGPEARAPGCVSDSSQIAAERSYRPFAVVLPQLSLARSF